jgi:hypothetical protein
VLTPLGLVLRKDASADSRVHEVLSLHRPLHMTPSDTLAVGLNGLLLQGSTPVDLSSSHYLAAAADGGGAGAGAGTGGTASAGGAGGEGKRTLAGLLHLGSMHSTHSTSSSSGNGNGNSGVQEEDWVKIHWSGSEGGASGAGAGANANANASDAGSSPRNPPAHVSASVSVAVSVPVPVPTRAAPPVANCKSLFSPCKYEVSFESKDEMNDWMDAIDECREVCFLP